MSENKKITRPTQVISFSPQSEHGCKNGWFRHMGSDYPCGACQEVVAYRKACEFYQVDSETLLSIPVPEGQVILWKQPFEGGSLSAGMIFVEPGDKLTELLVQSWQFVPRDIYEKRDEGFIEANPHLVADFVNPEEKQEKALPVQELAFTQSDVLAKVDEHYKYLDHAFALLGKDLSDPKGARSRFARFVTGDFKDEGKNFRPKSLQHKTAGRCFWRFIKNTEYDTHLELARDIVSDCWEQLEELLGCECYALAKQDDVWLDKAVITNMSAKAFQVEGWGWVPKSKVKFIKGKMVIPAWIAQSILEKKGE